MAAELANRSHLGGFLNALGLTGVGVEVGAYRGDFAREVLADWQGESWFLVDPWETTRGFLVRHSGFNWDMSEARRCAEQLARSDGRARLVRLGDPVAEATIPDLVDVVYVDGSHDTRSVLHDLETWWPRLRPGGLLCGHDYLDAWKWHGEVNQGVLFGVRTAVDWFAREHGRVVAATNEEYPTWWFRKPIGRPLRMMVLSGSTAELPWREIAIENHQAYCQRRGYEYRHHLIPPGDRPASWEKLRFIRCALTEADWVMWMDADALFMRSDVRLEDFWDGDSMVLWMKDTFCGLNLGVFFVRACDEAHEFLQLLDSMGVDPNNANRMWWENGAAMELEQRSILPGTILPHRLADSYPHMPGGWEPSDFVAHLAGLEYGLRLAMMEDFARRAELSFGQVGVSSAG